MVLAYNRRVPVSVLANSWNWRDSAHGIGAAGPVHAPHDGPQPRANLVNMPVVTPRAGQHLGPWKAPVKRLGEVQHVDRSVSVPIESVDLAVPVKRARLTHHQSRLGEEPKGDRSSAQTTFPPPTVAPGGGFYACFIDASPQAPAVYRIETLIRFVN